MIDAQDNWAGPRRFAFVHRHRLTILLAALVLLMLATPFVNLVVSELERVLVTVLYVVMLLAAVWAVSRKRGPVIIAAVLAVPAIALQLLHLAYPPKGIEIARELFAIAFIAYVIVAILRILFSDRRVTYNTIAASLCGYLLLGFLWSSVYQVLELIEPGSFSRPDSKGSSPESSEEFSYYALYYSLVTMTTLGYGDISPRTAPTRMFAVVQAVMGQIYLAVLVARLVALHIVHAQIEAHDHES